MVYERRRKSRRRNTPLPLDIDGDWKEVFGRRVDNEHAGQHPLAHAVLFNKLVPTLTVEVPDEGDIQRLGEHWSDQGAQMFP